MADLSEVKKIIVSIFNSYPRGISKDDLQRNYRQHTGQDIPFSSYGYATIISFLENELKDNVRVGGSCFNVMCYPEASQKSHHVATLVLNDNSNRRAPNRNYTPRR